MSAEIVVHWEAKEPAAAVVTIDRPRALNAINLDVLDQLERAFVALRESAVPFVVLTGAGERSFVAGADIAAMANLGQHEATAFARRGQRVLDQIAHYPGIVFAAVNGFAFGGGMELAMACDLILAEERAKFGQPEVNLGVIPGFGGTQRLTRRVGTARALELITTGRTISAQEALGYGLVLELCPNGGSVARSLEMAALMATKGPVAVRLAKEACLLPEERGMEDGLQGEAELFGRCFTTADQKEGMAAFLGKRPAVFVGR